MKRFAGWVWGLMALASVVVAQEPPKWMTDGPLLQEGVASFEVLVETLATKLYVDVDMGGEPRRFVVDTGSPSMIDATLAKELGLEVVGRNKGTDSHGVVIESPIVQGAVTIGGVTFQKVPMFVADFSGQAATRFWIGDGVLGSELLALGAWQIDRSNSVLRFHTDVRQLPFVEQATQMQLHTFGYPHVPILDVRFAKKARSKAMLDTGSPSYFAISSADLKDAQQAKGTGKTRSGIGSAGASLGGQAPNRQQLQVELKTLSVDKLKLGRVGAIRRDGAPSLLGASLLEHFVVTLDVGSGDAYFAEYADGPFARSSFGFSPAFGENITVALVWADSPAALAGLQPGLHLTAINGVATDGSQDGIRRVIEAMGGSEIELTWEGGSAKLSRGPHLLQD